MQSPFLGLPFFMAHLVFWLFIFFSSISRRFFWNFVMFRIFQFVIIAKSVNPTIKSSFIIQMFLGFPRSHFPDCDPEVETEGSDGCRPRPEALESGKGLFFLI